MKTKRVLWIDAVKGVGIVLITLSHIWGLIPYVGVCLFSCFIPLFVFVSGVVHKQPLLGVNRNSYMYKCVKRYLIPYFIYGIASIILTCLFYKNMTIYGVLSLFGGLLCGRYEYDGILMLGAIHNPALWFLPALFILKITYGCVGYLLEKKPFYGYWQ